MSQWYMPDEDDMEFDGIHLNIYIKQNYYGCVYVQIPYTLIEMIVKEQRVNDKDKLPRDEPRKPE